MEKGYYKYKTMYRKYGKLFTGRKIIAKPYDENNMVLIFNDSSTAVFENRYFNQLFEYEGSIREEY